MTQAQAAPSRLDLARITQALAARPDIAQWQVTELSLTRHERYLTFLAVESERQAAATSWQIWTARSAEAGQQGEAVFILGAGDPPSSLEARIEAALEASACSPNPAFDLPGPTAAGVAAGAVDTDALGDPAILTQPETALSHLADDYAAAAARCPWVRPSTLELFISTQRRRLVNHQGLDLCERQTRASFEFVLLHRPPGGEEVEFYDGVTATSLQALRLSERVERAARCVRDAAVATRTPAGMMPVVLADDLLAELIGYYRHHADASVHARKINAIALGSLVAGEPSGDAICLASDPTIPSLGGYRFDEHGYAPVRQRLITNGRLVGVCGSPRWMRALGQEPRGACGTQIVEPGSTALDALRPGALEIVRVSDLSARTDTGAFSGEIRLAYLHLADGTCRPVTGGSISGVLAEAMRQARFSAETVTCGSYQGPQAVRFDQLTVTS